MIYPILRSLAELAYEKVTPVPQGTAPYSVDKAMVEYYLPIQPFATGGLGNFPFYWEDSCLRFNYDTYCWINANLKAGHVPLEQALGSTFTNLFTEALSCISYSLSKEDQCILSESTNRLAGQQNALLSKWNEIFLPVTAVDDVLNTICQEWATSATTSGDLQLASDVSTILNKIPDKGQAIIPLLVDYLKTLNQITTLENSSSMNNGYLECVKNALQAPNMENGGILASSNDIYPAYEVSTSLHDILEGLQSDETIGFKMTIKSIDSKTVEVTGSSFEPFNTVIEELISLVLDGYDLHQNDVFNTIPTCLEVEMAFKGVVMVNFAPVPFNIVTGKSWYWIAPIVEAIKNRNQDVTGFKFSPASSLDFSKQGTFAFLTAVVISSYPEVSLKLSHTNPQQLSDAVNRSSVASLTLLGNIFDTFCTTTSSLIADADSICGENILIKLQPPTTNPPSLTSRAWVHGVVPCYPAT